MDIITRASMERPDRTEFMLIDYNSANAWAGFVRADFTRDGDTLGDVYWGYAQDVTRITHHYFEFEELRLWTS